MQNGKKKTNGTVMAAVALVAASALLIGAAAVIKKGKNGNTEESKVELSAVTEQSKSEVIENVSAAEESDPASASEESSFEETVSEEETTEESKPVHEESSEEVSEEPSEEVSEVVPEKTYEERVGVKYAIDIEPYLEYIEPGDDYLFLVNLTHPLDMDYVPENMVVSKYTRKDGRADQKLVYTAEMALEAMMAEAKYYGKDTNVTITSAYRSAAYQKQLFDMYTEQEMSAHPSWSRERAEQETLTYSMKPGCSEHQTGLCCDMHNLGSAMQSFGETPEAKWLASNCYRFGFILRYEKAKEAITGVEWEPWHFRFVGREAATEMHEKGMCLEEYTEYLKKK